MKIHRPVARDHRDPRPKRRAVAQRVKLLVCVEKNVLHQVVNFGARHTRQQNAVYKGRVKIVETSKTIPIAVQNRSDQHHLNRYFLRLLSGGAATTAR